MSNDPSISYYMYFSNLYYLAVPFKSDSVPNSPPVVEVSFGFLLKLTALKIEWLTRSKVASIKSTP